jgi:leucyl aminopeptidase
MPFSLNAKSRSANQVCFYTKKPKKLQFCSCARPEEKADVEAQYKEQSLSASFGEMVFYRNSKKGHQLCVSLGDKKVDAEVLRELVGKIYKKLIAEKVYDVSIALESLPLRDKASSISAMTEAFLLASYNFETFKKAPEKPTPQLQVDYSTQKLSVTLKKAMAEAEQLAESVNFARWLGDCPGNFMNPTQLAEEAKKAAKGTKMKVTAWDKAKIAKEKMDSLIGVSNGSDQEPRFIIMEYKGAAASKKPICFVGKGLTFDAGGISIKPSAGMQEMKYDMQGGAAVIGAMKAIAQLKLKVNAIAFIPASENLPGPSANKPGDIRKARNGKSIEINNTDAEGRLILADALVYASEKKPAWICDAATLTGAMVIALGNIHTGFYTRSKKMADLIQKAAAHSGEQVWPMPLCDHHSDDMKGTFADLTNLAPSRGAGSATAAAFLENFVEKDIPWAHFDVAGTAWNAGNRLSYNPAKGATGVMVRTFVQMARNHR